MITILMVIIEGFKFGTSPLPNGRPSHQVHALHMHTLRLLTKALVNLK
jgi:hypothetical protein